MRIHIVPSSFNILLLLLFKRCKRLFLYGLWGACGETNAQTIGGHELPALMFEYA